MRRHTVLLPLSIALLLPLAAARIGPVTSGSRPLACAAPTSQATPGTSASQEAEAPDRRRILKLEDGSLLRARTRQQQGRWERRVGPLWEPLEVGVRRARLERELLAESRAMAAQVGPADHASRTVLARWMIEQGLGREALAELDRVLSEEPDHAAAIALVRHPLLELELADAPPAGSPQYVLAVLLAAVRRGPAERELCIRSLEELGEQLDMDSLIRSELLISVPRRRAFAALLAERFGPHRFLKELCDHAILDSSPAARLAAARALASTREVGVIAPAVRALASEHARVRSNAAAALGALGFPAAVEPLVAHLSALQAGGAPSGVRANLFSGLQTAYVRDYDVEIAQAAAIADPIIGVLSSGVVFDVRATAQITQVIEMQTTMQSLRQLTGALPASSSPDAWREWWRVQGDSWRSADHLRPASPAK